MQSCSCELEHFVTMSSEHNVVVAVDGGGSSTTTYVTDLQANVLGNTLVFIV